ncbi:MAG: hypothetical protein U1F56_25785 [Rubrivivax sp.]
MTSRLSLAAGVLLAAAPLAFAQTPDAALLRCAAAADATARLACFDALVAQARTRAAQPSASAASAAVAAFGRPSPPDEIELIESRIVGRFEGWRAGDRITLANGQVWQVIDDSSAWADLQQPVARVRRAAMGSFRLEVDGVTRSPRVRRVQ